MKTFDNTDLYYINNNLTGHRNNLFELAKWKNGLAFKNIDFSETGKPIIKIAELNNGISSSTAFSNKEYSHEVHLVKGDLVFSWSGNPQTSIDIFRYNLPDGWLNQHIFKVTPFNEIVDKNFFFYIMKFLKPTFTAIATNKQTTGLGHVTISDLKRISLQIPPLPVQKKIAGILKSLDDKIELNRQISKNLEEQARAIYENTFITNTQSSWKRGYLSDLIDVKYGKDHKKFSDGIYPVYGSGGIMRYIEKPLYSKESVLVPRKGTLNNVIYVNEPFWSVDTMFYTEMKRRHIAKFIFHFLKNKDLASLNAGSAVPSMTTNILNAMELPIPDDSTFLIFDNLVTPLYTKIQANEKQSLHLAQIRDTILPKLMSGEIEV